MGPQKTQLPPAIGASDPQRPGGMGAEASDTSLSEAVSTLRKRKWILILAMVLGVVYGAYKAATQPKLYQAASIIQVHNGASNAFRVEESYDFSDDTQTKMNSEALILQSDTLLYTVAREMDLANNPDFLGAKGPVPHASIDDSNVRANVVNMLKSNLQVSLIPRTEMMRISYISPSARLSAEIVNQVVKDYILRSFSTPVKQTGHVADFLADNMDELKSQLERAQDQMMNLQRKLGVLGYSTDSAHSQLQTSLEDLLSAEETAKIARMTTESRYRMVSSMDPNTIGESIETTPGTAPGELNQLRAQLAADQAQYADLGATLGAKNPRMQALQDQIAELTKTISEEQSRLVIQAKESYLAAKASEDKIEQELDTKKKEAYDQGNDMVELSVVQREYEQDRALYEGLKQRLETAKVESGLDASEVDQVDAALPPVRPTMESPGRIILTTTLFFLLGGIVIAFLVESLDTGLHNIQEIEQVMEMPSLAVIPRSKRSTPEQAAAASAVQRNITVLTQPKSQFTESFRSLQTSLLLATAGQPPRFILFTSATPSEGKTTAASNLACILAQGEVRVLLIDADLRRPSVHHRFGLTGKAGLTTVLAGTSSFEEAVQRVRELPNLDVLPSGPVPPFPTEMLSSEAMKALLEKLGKLYTHVVIDSPPILSVTDAAILGRMVDAVVLVVRHGKSSKNVMRRARDLMIRSGAPVAGLVLNAVDVASPEYYGYYGYTGYSYGSADADSWETQSVSAGDAEAERNAKR
ncbi:MAG: polysaccharide biosynthesis tyrosine autokinase [Acidobacteriaceae bacterium]|jgi:capsular exopolysaccharide synthesis family protein